MRGACGCEGSAQVQGRPFSLCVALSVMGGGRAVCVRLAAKVHGSAGL